MESVMKYPFFCRRYWRAILYFWFRRLIKHDLFFVSLEDFFFWVWAGLYLFVKIYDTSDGSIRWFFTIGVVVGGVCSFFVLHFLSEMGKKLFARIREKDEKSIDKSKEKR